MTWIRHSLLSTVVAVIACAAMGCGDESPVGTGTARTIDTHTMTIENADYNSGTGKGFVNLYDGVLYSKADLAANADDIDFRHQYRGVDIGNARLLENMTHTNRWGGGITNPTDSRIAPTTLTAADFDLIRNDRQLLNSFDFTTSMDDRQFLSDIDDNPTASVYAFIDKNGKRGLFKVISADVAPINTAPQGNLKIEVKVEL